MNMRWLPLFLIVFCTNVFAQGEPATISLWDDVAAEEQISAEMVALKQEMSSRPAPWSPAQNQEFQEKLDKITEKIKKLGDWQQIKNHELPVVKASLRLFDAIWKRELNSAILNGGRHKPQEQINELQENADKLDKYVKEANEWIEKIPSLKRYTEAQAVKEFKAQLQAKVQLKKAVLVGSDSDDPIYLLFKAQAELLYLNAVFSQWLKYSPLDQ